MLRVDRQMADAYNLYRRQRLPKRGSRIGGEAMMKTADGRFRLASHLLPLKSYRNVIRFVIAFVVGFIGARAGVDYVHLCSAGSRLIEYAASFGTLVVCLILVIFIRRDWISLPLAAVVILVVELLADPYVVWVHGSWPGSLK